MANNVKRKGLKISEAKAKQYVNDPEKTKLLLKNAMKKANRNKGPLKKIWDNLTALFRLVGAWAKGEYKNVPKKVILLAISAIIYFLMPFDLIPDFMPVSGYIDDAAVVGYVIKSTGEYLENFRVWEKQKNEELSGNDQLAA